MTRQESHDNVLLVTRALERLSEDLPRRRDLPEARYFWMATQLIPNRAAQERALKPMGVLQVFAHAVVAICWALLITWKWPAIKLWLGTPDLVTRLLDSVVGASSVSLSYLMIVGGLLCITSVVVLHSVFAEE